MEMVPVYLDFVDPRQAWQRNLYLQPCLTRAIRPGCALLKDHHCCLRTWRLCGPALQPSVTLMGICQQAPAGL